MKKVLVLVVAAAVLAAPAFGAILGSKHDLSSKTGTSAFKDTAASPGSETCVFCHTPHGAVTGILAPLWNRSIPGAVLTQLYNSATLDQTYSRPGVVSTAVNNSDAPLCLSCHDGAGLSKALLNPSNTDGAPTNANITGAGLIGTDLRNDHPIGMSYASVQGADTAGFNASPDARLTLYTASNVMWCSTCHDVHNQGAPGVAALLNMSNTGSALCVSCHIK